MTVAERHQMILRLLAERDRVAVTELARATGASEMTIRRDLEQLESRGALRRIHGGAINMLLRGVEPPYGVRSMVGSAAKTKLAAAVVDLLEDGETVALDTGTTMVAVAERMAGRRLTVTPLSLHATWHLADRDEIRLLMPGGQLRPGELAFQGDAAVRAFEDLHYDTFIIGCCGIDAAAGATAYDLEDVRIKRAAVHASRRLILVATAEKLGHVAFGRICRAEEVDLMVTDAPEEATEVRALRAAGVEIMHV